MLYTPKYDLLKEKFVYAIVAKIRELNKKKLVVKYLFMKILSHFKKSIRENKSL